MDTASLDFAQFLRTHHVTPEEVTEINKLDRAHFMRNADWLLVYIREEIKKGMR